MNLHANGALVKILSQIITGKHAMSKHRFLLDYMIKNGAEVADFVTLEGTTFPKGKKLKSLLLRKIEAKYVLRKNGFSKRNIKLIANPYELKTDDIVICQSTIAPGQFELLENINAIKIVDHMHFYGEKEASDSLKDKGIQYYMFDVDLDKYSKLYQENYSWFTGEFIMRPYSYQPRFAVKKNFNDRMTKAVAMGTLTKCLMPEFIEMYGSEYYQPHRKMIMDNAYKYPDEIDSYISEYQETALKEIKDDDMKITRLFKKTYNYFHAGQQKAYFSFDMVDKYNEYKMFICPEDINGSYGVGTIEGMACGCAMIGWNYGAFEDMGMAAGKHYIAYDGTMDNLIAKIRYYQRPENQDELENIAKTGCKFIRENFSEEAVAKRYYEDLKKISEKGR